MKFRKLVVLAAVAMIAALLPAMSVQAEPHLPKAEPPHTACDVNGTVTIGGGGVDEVPSGNNYTFVDTALACVGDYNGVLDVEAEGNTTDSGHGTAGEDCSQGGSTVENGEFHSGKLTAKTGDTPTIPANIDIEGGVHFFRLGTNVIADGPLTDNTTGRDGYFHAVLVFIPVQGTCELPGSDDAITEALLEGEANIWDGHGHDCGADGTSDPHCE